MGHSTLQGCRLRRILSPPAVVWPQFFAGQSVQGQGTHTAQGLALTALLGMGSYLPFPYSTARCWCVEPPTVKQQVI